EVVSAVERAISEIRLRHEREQLAKQLEESNLQLERRVRELTTLFGLGKTVTSTTHQGQLFDKLMEGSIYVTEADMGWVLLPEENDPQLYLRAQRNLPSDLKGKLHQPWDDGVSSLVMLSGEALAIHGEGLSQFKLARFGEAALIAPIKVRDQSIGVITVARVEARPFSERAQAMLEAVADYASISLVNARLFQALEARAHRLQQMIDEAQMDAQARADWRAGLNRDLRAAQAQIAQLLEEVKDSKIRAGLETVNGDLEAMLREVSSISPTDPDEELSSFKSSSTD
ncbi:MAG: GAF domain-containing protein, partial [Anaerolineales bacterium]|nr:GAF domain-containing protein [Anaerolineales bacterium]